MSVTESQLSDEIRDVTLQVHTAEERKEDRELVATAHQAVARVNEHYRELISTVGEGEKMRIESRLGRRLTDLRRLASLLPRIGALGGSTPDRQVLGTSVAGERKITGVSWGAGERAFSGAGSLRVGGDVEAWCGPCGELTTHSIIAMVGTEPKQVVCQVCNNRHNFRTTPTRRTTAGDETSGTSVGGSFATAADLEARRRAEHKAEELRALSNQLAHADNVRDWDPKERYKVGDVVSHPEYGRGKVETVLRSSVLVRFGRGGLKSLMLS